MIFAENLRRAREVEMSIYALQASGDEGLVRYCVLRITDDQLFGND